MADKDKIERLKQALPSFATLTTLKSNGTNKLCGACPKCGGTDRFYLNVSEQKAYCTHCNKKGGDILHWHCFIKGLDEKTGTIELLKEYLPIDIKIQDNIKVKAEWQAIKHIDDKACYQLLNARGIDNATIEALIKQGKIKPAIFKGVLSVAFQFTTLTDNKNVLAIEYFTATQQPYTKIDKNKQFGRGSKPSLQCFFQCGKPITAPATKGIIITESVLNAVSGAMVLPEYSWFAIGSTVFTDKIKALKPYIKDKPVICAFDNDKAGSKATTAINNILKNNVFSITWQKESHKDGYDLNDFIRIDKDHTRTPQPELIIELINNAQPLQSITTPPQQNTPDIDNLPFCFWYMNKKGEVFIKQNELYKLLEAKGFYNTTLYGAKILVRIVDNIINKVESADIRNAVMNEFMADLPEFLNGFDKAILEEKLRQGIGQYLSEPKIETLKQVKLNFYRDKAGTTALFFKNGFVEITGSGFTLKPYSELNGYIWRDSIIDHEIDITENINNDICKYQQFLRNVCTNPDTMFFDSARHKALLTVHGYLLHRYNDPAYPKAVIFSDGNLEEESNGRTGKSLICKAIGKIRKIRDVKGRRANLDSQFALQNITIDTELIVFDDIKKNFNFELFFGDIIDGYTIEYKKIHSFQFSRETNPKTIITTNYSVKGTGASHNGRKYEIELLPYYNDNFTPAQDLGGKFFEWSKEQWNNFYCFMFTCSQQYHKAGDKMLEYNSDTLELKKLQVEIGQDFIDFADNLPRNEFIISGFIIEKYKKTLSDKGKSFVSEKTFGNNLKKYCKNKGIELEKKQVGEYRQLHYYLKDTTATTAPLNTGGYTPPQLTTAPVQTSINLNTHLEHIEADEPEPQQVELSHMAEREHHSFHNAPAPPAEKPVLKCRAFSANDGNCHAITMFEHKSGKATPTPCNIKTCKYKEKTNIHELIELEN